MIIRIRLSEGHGSTIKQLFPYFKKDIAKFIKNVFFEKDVSNIDSLTSNPIASGVKLMDLEKLSPKFQAAKRRLNLKASNDLIYYELYPNIMSHYILAPGPAGFTSPETGSDEFKIVIGIYYNPIMLQTFSYEKRLFKIKEIFEKLIKELAYSIEHELQHWYQTVFNHPQERSKKLQRSTTGGLFSARIDFLSPEEVFAYARESIKKFIIKLKEYKDTGMMSLIYDFMQDLQDDISDRLDYNYPKLTEQQVENIADAHVALKLMAIKAIRPDLFKTMQKAGMINDFIIQNYKTNPEVKRALKNFKVKLKPA